jgi:hypothetical protein
MQLKTSFAGEWWFEGDLRQISPNFAKQIFRLWQNLASRKAARRTINFDRN